MSFSHENQLHPPSLSDHGKIRACKKSVLIKCLKLIEESNKKDFDCKIFDGAALTHMLKPNAAKSSQEYADEVFVKFIQQQLQSLKRIDIIWDRYLANSIKGSAREKRGAGVRRKVSSQSKISSNLLNFLRDPNNKTKLFAFLTKVASEKLSLEGKEIYITSDESVVSLCPSTSMPDCTHEEADTRIMVHVIDAIRKGLKSICIRTVDTDILIILISKFHFLKDLCKDLELKVAFGIGKDFAVYSVNNICSTLGPDKSKIMSIFHAFSGCDTISSFHGRGKKSAWESLVSFPEVKVAFQYMVDHPFEALDISSPHFKFTVILYNRTSASDSVNKAKRELLARKTVVLRILCLPKVPCCNTC